VEVLAYDLTSFFPITTEHVMGVHVMNFAYAIKNDYQVKRESLEKGINP
jgi:hypothetical protein